MLGKIISGSRQFSNRVIKGRASQNLTAWNKELRPNAPTERINIFRGYGQGYEDFQFKPYENQMHANWGNRVEFLFLALAIPAVVLLKGTRTKNEDGIRNALGHSNNRYAVFAKVNPSEL